MQLRVFIGTSLQTQSESPIGLIKLVFQSSANRFVSPYVANQTWRAGNLVCKLEHVSFTRAQLMLC